MYSHTVHVMYVQCDCKTVHVLSIQGECTVTLYMHVPSLQSECMYSTVHVVSDKLVSVKCL